MTRTTENLQTMEAEAKKQAVEQAAALSDLYVDNKIGLEIYGRWMLRVAYNLMLEDELQLAVGVCTEVPEQYYQEWQPVQMAEDAEFSQMSEYLAKRFQVHGLVESEFKVNIISRIGVC